MDTEPQQPFWKILFLLIGVGLGGFLLFFLLAGKPTPAPSVEPVLPPMEVG